MTGELAQIINLITQYNSGIIESDLYKENSTYQYCNTLNFLYFKKKFFAGHKEVIVASSIQEWFQYLKKENVNKLLLVFRSDNSKLSDHKTAGFIGGGGNWFIEAEKLEFSDFWQSKWEVNPNKEDEEDYRVWNVTYGLTIPNQKHFEHFKYDITNQKDKLRNTLLKISNFATSNENTTGWEKTFNNAIETLENKNPSFDYHKDLIPEGSLPIENLQLLIAATKSFVFGGMGSWNDIGWFENEDLTKKYDEISAELYQVMNESIIAAVNCK
ncbi:MAG: hypothetical protein JXR05_12570 [Flavobacteriaceae bacterium]